jgi:hypothetical protein
MSQCRPLLETLLRDVAGGEVPRSSEHAAELIKPLTVGLRSKVPIIMAGARLFRVRKMDGKPLAVSDAGAPPANAASIGRLNESGQSVLYLADSPDTAFQEIRAIAGLYCLSEWRVQPERVVLANGGMPRQVLTSAFPNDLDPPGSIPGGVEDDEVAELFRIIFTLPMRDPLMYRWSIACGLANGFAHICERTAKETVNGNTVFSGRYPFCGIAYASVRSDKRSINYAFNDLGRTYLRLNHVQWVEWRRDGTFAGLDFASSWGADGNIAWLGRPARFELASGDSARVTKVAENMWSYESIDGNIPGFV